MHAGSTCGHASRRVRCEDRNESQPMKAKLLHRLRPLLACLVVAFFTGVTFAETEPLRVFVSVLPQKTIVEKIGGAHVDVRSMVRRGYSPHTYDPAPRQIAALSATDLYVRSGVPFEHAWMARIRSANPDMQIMDASSGIDVGAIAHRGNGEAGQYHAGHSLTGRDPHIWTSPPLVEQMAGNIRDKLTELDPAHKQDYARNHDVFAAELETLDRDIRMLLKDLPNRRFMVFHPAWGYFADTYGLVQIPIETEGKEPGARALAALIEQAKREGVKAIFVQPQFSAQSAEQVARSIGGRVVPIDPLSSNYTDNLRAVARQIAEAARK